MTDIDTTTSQFRWRDSTRPAGERAAALLSLMTREEKLQQLGSTWPNASNASGDVAPMQETQMQAEPFEDAIRGGIGQITRPFGTLPVEPAEGVSRLRRLQEQVMDANRFGIPAIVHEECLTGFTAWTATVYPAPIAWAATFSPDLVTEMAMSIGRDMRSVGVHQGLSPVLDVVRDYRWGRVEETLGEDPYVVGEMASAYVTGLQSAGIVATLKHFVGYSASRGARNHAPVSAGARELADVLLPPFEKAVVKAGARSVMNAYTDLDGVPSGADRTLLTELLRDTWGFEGTVVSDYWSVPFLVSMHRIARDNTDAGMRAMRAGMDVELPHTLGFSASLLDEPDADGLIDRAVLRVLTQKAELGLLDEQRAPVPSPADIDLDSPANRALARAIADESIILLENRRGLLPLAEPSRIAVIGPGADDAGCFFGCYSFPNHVMPNHPELPIGVVAPTLAEAIVAEFPGAHVEVEQGVQIVGGDRQGIAAAVAAAARADVTVLVVGDRSGMFGHGTSGEGCDVADLRLPGLQEELATAVLDASPNVVLVSLSGRPYAIGPLVQRAAAAVQAFIPGEEGGSAIAAVLSGAINPSGRLPVQLPGSSAAQPGTYLAPPLGLRSDGISNLDPTPAFPFGHGLSYTSFTVSDVRGSHERIPVDGSTTIHATVTNTGERAGATVVQLYLTDPVASVVRPVRQLIGFAKVRLDAGEVADVEFDVPADLASFTGSDGRRRVEPGEIVLTVADSAADDGSAVHVTLVGDIRYLDHRREMNTFVRCIGRSAALQAGAQS